MEQSDTGLHLEGRDCFYSPTRTKGRFSQKKDTRKDAGRMAKKQSFKGVDTDRLLSDIKRSFARVSNEESMTFKQKISFLESVRLALDSEKDALEKHYTPQLPTPSSNYPRYPGCGEDALKWLETHWGKYLKYFGADKDYLYQDQLDKLDKKLLSTLKTIRYRDALESNGKKVRDVVPRKSERITEKINELLHKNNKELIDAYYVSSKRKSRNSISAEPQYR